MREIFLSASVPNPDNPNFETEGNPTLIHAAVRELVYLILGNDDLRLVWGGHPAITPMILQFCQSLGVDDGKKVTLYQSKFFGGAMPPENERFKDVVLVDPVDQSREDSLTAMRVAMLGRPDLDSAVFIGGMKGLYQEYALFRELHPDGRAVFVASTGGVAGTLAKDFGYEAGNTLDFGRLYRKALL
ncbi:MAG: hypothetical protein JST12_14850 [Armatimonadetes bacterium]|nr:hypothetical protein [Armatimonadota bacterium]